MTEIQIMEFVPAIIGFVLSVIILGRMRLFGVGGTFFRTLDDAQEQQEVRVVTIAGIAIFPLLLLSLCPSLGLPKLCGLNEISASKIEMSTLRILQVIAGCALLYVVGLKNDIHGTGVQVKSLALLAVACIFPVTNLCITDCQGIFGIHELPLWLGAPLTVVFVMYITESVALMDDISGLGVGMVTIICCIFLVFCVTCDFVLGVLVISAVLGLSLPYTFQKLFNKSWRKTLVGNAGSYTLGYVMSYLSLALIRQSGQTMPEGMLMIVSGILMVPLLDVLRMIHDRVREGRSMLSLDRNLMQHRLYRMGIKLYWTPLVIIAVMVCFAALNSIWVLKKGNLTVLSLVDISLWFAMQFAISYFIRKREQKAGFKAWNMYYGRDVWEANVPVDVIHRKHINYGSLGMPASMILGKELDFIPDGMNAFERNTKRMFDLFSSAIMIVLTSPLFLLSYILIKLDDGGPVLYSQERLGRFGRPFYIYKFRSMRLDAEKSGPALSHSGGDDDPRLTRVGKFLRAHHLDELPQLWNVFCGDMSFIGYRPERKFFIDQIMEQDPRYSFLYQIRPGVTSYATLYNGYTDTMEKMLRRLNYDLYYLEHRSFLFDFRILWLTFISIIFGKKF